MSTKTETLELAVLSAITDQSQLDIASEIGLTHEHFFNQNYGRYFQYLQTLASGNKPLPTLADKKELWQLDLPENHADVFSLGNEIIRLHRARKTKEVIARQVAAVDTDPDLAITNLLEDLSKIKPASTKARYYETSASDRIADIKMRAENRRLGRFIGIPTGFEVFDVDGIGIQPGEVVTIVGKSGVGKSWLLGKLCVNAYRAGYKILYLSPEMSANETELRIDVMMMGSEGLDISHRALLSGQESILQNYENWASRFSNSDDQRWVTVDSDRQGGFTIGSIYDLLTTHKPDVLAIDGFHLLAGQSSGQSWENVKRNADGIKAFALLKGVSVYNVTQAQRGVGVHENPELENTAYGYAIVEASDKVASIGNIRGYPERRALKVLKWRNGSLPLFRVNLVFDVDAGRVEQQGTIQDEDPDDEDF